MPEDNSKCSVRILCDNDLEKSEEAGQAKDANLQELSPYEALPVSLDGGQPPRPSSQQRHMAGSPAWNSSEDGIDSEDEDKESQCRSFHDEETEDEERLRLATLLEEADHYNTVQEVQTIDHDEEIEEMPVGEDLLADGVDDETSLLPDLRDISFVQGEDWLKYLPYDPTSETVIERFKDKTFYNHKPPGIDPNDKRAVQIFNLGRPAEPSTKDIDLEELVSHPFHFVVFFGSSDGTVCVCNANFNEDSLKSGVVVFRVSGSNISLIEICQRFLVRIASDPRLQYVVGPVEPLGPWGPMIDYSPGLGFYHEGRGEFRFRVASVQNSLPLLITILELLAEYDPLRHSQAVDALHYLRIQKSTTHIDDNGHVVANGAPFMNELIYPYLKICRFNSSDPKVKGPLRAAAVRDFHGRSIENETFDECVDRLNVMRDVFGAVWAADGSTTLQADESTNTCRMAMCVAMSRDNPLGAEFYQEFFCGVGSISCSTKLVDDGVTSLFGDGPAHSVQLVFASAFDIKYITSFLAGAETVVFDSITQTHVTLPPLDKPVCVGKIQKPLVLLAFYKRFFNPQWTNRGGIRFCLCKLKETGAMKKIVTTNGFQKWHLCLHALCNFLKISNFPWEY